MSNSSPADKWPELDFSKLPQHIAVIMDGNGRWAKSHGLPRLEGHRRGIGSVRAVVRTSRELGVKALTLFAFSTENWGRPKTEVKGLMELLKQFLKAEEAEMIEQGIQLRTIGQTDHLPAGVRKVLKQTMAKTSKGRDMALVLALSYGARAEITEAVRGVARDCVAGRLDPDKIDENLVAGYLQTADLPEVDLLIRTSGENRLSNFLLWQLAYSELWITPVYWPDFREEHLIEALVEYQGRERRFGLVPQGNKAEKKA